jgi:hypothetical protein
VVQARAANVPDKRLIRADEQLSAAKHAQWCGRALKASMLPDLFTNVDMDVRRRKAALEKAVYDARNAGVPEEKV